MHFLTDSGRFAYSGNLSKYRDDYAILTRAHNTLRIDDQDEEPGPATASSPLPSSEWAIDEDHDWARGSIGYQHVHDTAVHTRAMWFHRGSGSAAARTQGTTAADMPSTTSSVDPPFWVVVDRIQTSQDRQVEALWHTHPNNTATLSGSGNGTRLQIDTTQDSTAHMMVVPATYNIGLASDCVPIQWTGGRVIRGQTEPVLQGWYSKEYDVYRESDTTVYNGTISAGPGDQNATAAWLLYPWRGEASDPVDRVAITKVAQDSVTVTISIGDNTAVVVVPV